MAKETYDQWWRRRSRWLNRLEEVKTLSLAAHNLLDSYKARLKSSKSAVEKAKIVKDIADAKSAIKRAESEIKKAVKAIKQINREEPQQ